MVPVFHKDLVTVDVVHIAGIRSQQQPIQEHMPATTDHLSADIANGITSMISLLGTESRYQRKVLSINEEAAAIFEEDFAANPSLENSYRFLVTPASQQKVPEGTWKNYSSFRK